MAKEKVEEDEGEEGDDLTEAQHRKLDRKLAAVRFNLAISEEDESTCPLTDALLDLCGEYVRSILNSQQLYTLLIDREHWPTLAESYLTDCVKKGIAPALRKLKKGILVSLSSE